MKKISNLPLWFWGSVVGIGLISVSVVLFYLLKQNSSVAPYSQETMYRAKFEPESPDSLPVNVKPHAAATKTDTMLVLMFPIGSVEEVCRIHEYPFYWDYWDYSDDTEKEDPRVRTLTSQECKDALEKHVGAINPYRWGRNSVHLQFALVVLENPLTFERIFADPSGDFARVQDAMSRDECLLEQGTAKNFELREPCHADAFLNFALFNRFCHYGGISDRARKYFREDTTREQSNSMWKQSLEGLWVKKKCSEFVPELKLTEDRYPELTKLLSSLGNPESLALTVLRDQQSELSERKLPDTLPPSHLITILIEMAARLGDDAAALTRRYPFGEDGASLGRFKGVLFNYEWVVLQSKREPSQGRMLQMLHYLPNLATADIKINWEWLVRHLCEPPFEPNLRTRYSDGTVREEPSESKSCRTVINELYSDRDLSDSELEMIEKFERTALELQLYH